MKKPWLAALLNFFFMGLGTLYVGERKAFGAVLTLGALALTHVEFGIQESEPTLYGIMFGTILVMNTMFAIDGHREAKLINSKAKPAA